MKSINKENTRIKKGVLSFSRNTSFLYTYIYYIYMEVYININKQIYI